MWCNLVSHSVPVLSIVWFGPVFLDPLGSAEKQKVIRNSRTHLLWPPKELQSVDYHLVNKGFWFIGGQLPSRIRSKCIRGPDLSHSGDFSLQTFREWSKTQGELPSEASDYCNVCLLCFLMYVVMYLCSYFYYKYIWPPIACKYCVLFASKYLICLRRKIC